MELGPEDDELSLKERIMDNPRPAMIWLAGALLLLSVQFGAVAETIMSVPPWNDIVDLLPVAPGAAALAAFGDRLADLPTLLSRETIPNQGYYHPETGWENTFLGLSPAWAWAVRVALIYVYAFVWCGWLWYAYEIFREHYRYADWTPRDDMVDRLRVHRWGQFGLVIVIAFLVMALFAPAMSPTVADANLYNPYSYDFEYYDDDVGEVVTITEGAANAQSYSRGGDANIGPMQYDDFDRFAPFGTMQDGKDLFTFMAYGARVSLFIGLLYLFLAGFIATAFALLTAYYKGLVDLAVVITGDSIQAMPQLLLLIMLSVVLGGTWIAEIYNGGLILALIFAATGWPGLWRAVRGPALQVSEQEWIDAAKSFGQRPSVTMQKHMFPYVLGYLLIYSSMNLGGVIIGVAGLSFLGIGVNPPTPEWGRAVSGGQPYVETASWHISLLPGIMIVFVVTAFNALGDGIRDAIDPKIDVGGGEDEAAGSAAGGGA